MIAKHQISARVECWIDLKIEARVRISDPDGSKACTRNQIPLQFTLVAMWNSDARIHDQAMSENPRPSARGRFWSTRRKEATHINRDGLSQARIKATLNLHAAWSPGSTDMQSVLCA